MQRIKVLHCADLHLGSQVSSIPEKANERKNEILKTFRNIINLCKQESVDIMLIAGDLFEGANIDGSVIDSVKEYLRQLDTKVFISPGNHDYVSLDSPYIDNNWSENVKIFKGEFESYRIDEINTVVYGAGFRSTYVKESLFNSQIKLDQSMINLCVIHGDLISRGQESQYHGITPFHIERSNMDYIALGHIHKKTPIQKINKTFYAYSGCPDGRGFDEIGIKGVYLGEITKGNVDLKFHPTSSRQYIRVNIDISEYQSETEVENHILDYLNQNYGDKYRENLYRITLIGVIDKDISLPIKNIEMYLADQIYYIKLIDNTSYLIDYELLSKEISLKGIFAKRMLEKIEKASKEEKEVYEKALEYGMRSFEGESALNDY